MPSQQLLEVEHSLQYYTAGITRRGLRVDKNEVERQTKIMQAGVEAATTRLDDIGLPTNVETNDGREILCEFFTAMDVPVVYSETSVGNWISKHDDIPYDDDLAHCMKVGADDLRLATMETDEFVKGAVRDLVFIRQAEKFQAAYLDAFLAGAELDGRLHPTIRTMAARTHRMSISTPPLQQIPSRAFQVVLPDGSTAELDIRGCLTADDGCVLVGADFASVEARVVATLANEQSMIEAIKRGDDLHIVVASNMYSVAPEDVTPEQRQYAKRAQYLTLYGGGPRKLALSVDIPLSTAEDVIKRYREAYPGIRQFARDLQKQDLVVTPFGRELPIDPLRKYASLNYLVQSTARDLLVIGMMRLVEQGYGPRLFLPIHDEIILNVPEDTADDVAKEMTRLMSMDFFGTPIDAEGEVLGYRWRTHG